MRLQKSILNAIDAIGMLAEAQERRPGGVTVDELAKELALSSASVVGLMSKLHREGLVLYYARPVKLYLLDGYASRIKIGDVIKAMYPDEFNSFESNSLNTATALGFAVALQLEITTRTFFEQPLERFIKLRRAGIASKETLLEALDKAQRSRPEQRLNLL